MSHTLFDILILIARPAAGKSEVIDYLKRTPVEERIQRFRVGELVEIDDFPMLWTWFEEDHILQEMGHPRLHTTSDQYFKDNILWQLLIRRISLDYDKLKRDRGDLHETHTALVEFSRGAEHGGYTEAFQHLSEEILSRAGVMYIEVSYEESLAKNQNRFNPDRPDSILEHGLPDEKMKTLYKDDDFSAFSAGDPHYLQVKGTAIPYVIFENHDDVTTGRGEALGARLEARLATLWERYHASSSK